MRASRLRGLPLLVIVVGVASSVAGQNAAGQAGGAATCGAERWAVKTLSDRDASRVNLHPVATSVTALRRLAAPSVLPDTRLPGVERHTYKVRARLIAFKREEDHDIHLVIAQPGRASATMISEFPDTTCPGARSSAERAEMRRARASLVAACGQPSSSSFRSLHGLATISGVGFFDFNHGQRGVAPNAIELHPVLKIRVASC
jgi:hypothetical protein